MGVLGTIVSDGAKGIVEGVGGVLDKLFTSDDERAKAAIALKEIEQAPFLKNLDILLEEARHPSIFVAGGRPALIWACVGTVVYEGILRGFLTWILLLVDPTIPPPPSVGEIMWEVVSLGFALAGVRSIERVKGVARGNLKP